MAFLKGDLSAPSSRKMEKYQRTSDLIGQSLNTLIEMQRNEKADMMSALNIMINNSSNYTEEIQYDHVIDILDSMMPGSSRSTKGLLGMQKELLLQGKDNIRKFDEIETARLDTEQKLNNLKNTDWNTEAASEILGVFTEVGEELKSKTSAKLYNDYTKKYNNYTDFVELTNDINAYDIDKETSGFQHSNVQMQMAWDALEIGDVKRAQTHFDASKRTVSDLAWDVHQNEFARRVSNFNKVYSGIPKNSNLRNTLEPISTLGLTALPEDPTSIALEKTSIEDAIRAVINTATIDDTNLRDAYEKNPMFAIMEHVGKKVLTDKKPWERVSEQDVFDAINDEIDFGSFFDPQLRGEEDQSTRILSQLILMYSTLEDADVYLNKRGVSSGSPSESGVF